MLFDENLSPKLVDVLTDIFPDSAYVDRIEFGGSCDDNVWSYAKANGFSLVSKDADFYDKSMLYGHPPKVIWIKRGNCTNRQIQLLLRNKLEAISSFIQDDQISFIAIT